VAAVLLCATGCGRRESAADRAARDGILLQSLGMQEEPRLDPHLAEKLNEGSALRALLEGLVAPDPRTLEPQPALAESWDVSNDGLVHTFHLRGDARWSNGDPVTAVDFVASYRRALSPDLGVTNAGLMHVLRGARAFNRGTTPDFSTVGVEAPDERTLRLTLEAPCPHFLSLLTHWVWMPVHMGSVRGAGPETSRANRWARPESFVGNGPFRIVEHETGQFIRLEPNPLFHDRSSLRLNGIVFHFLGVSAEEAALRAGQIHITDALPIGRVPSYRRDRPSLIRITPAFGAYFYRINVTRPPFDDARVRRAFSAAINRDLLVSTVLNDAYTPAHSFTPPGVAGYKPPTLAVDDAELARRLLAEAGFAGGAGMRRVEILYNTSENHRLIAEAVQQIWRTGIGVEPVLANQEDGVFRDTCRQLSYDVARGSWFGDYLDPFSFLEIFTTGNANNYTGWSNADYDRLVAEAGRTSDPARRLALLAQAESILLTETPIIPIYVYSYVRLVDPRVQGWFDNPLDQHPYTAISLDPGTP
jgi:oligopeptide transport system substrate-binding protein